jgi:hypothetical protein
MGAIVGLVGQNGLITLLIVGRNGFELIVWVRWIEEG